MSFGNVLKKLAVSLLVLPITVSATVDIDKAEAKANLEVGRCLKATSRPVYEFQDKWLDSLNPKQKRLVMYELGRRALERCNKSAYEKYSWALVQYAASTGDSAKLNSFVALQSGHEPIKLDEYLPVGYEKEIQRISHTEQFYYPFDSMVLRDKYHSE